MVCHIEVFRAPTSQSLWLILGWHQITPPIKMGWFPSHLRKTMGKKPPQKNLPRGFRWFLLLSLGDHTIFWHDPRDRYVLPFPQLSNLFFGAKSSIGRPKNLQRMRANGFEVREFASVEDLWGGFSGRFGWFYVYFQGKIIRLFSHSIWPHSQGTWQPKLPCLEIDFPSKRYGYSIATLWSCWEIK